MRPASRSGRTRPIVHGDYRLDNTILDQADVGRIAAVLDWEMSTLGDPLADLGLLLTYWRDEADQADVADRADAVGHLDARLPRPGRCGRGLCQGQRVATSSTCRFYVAFGYFKLAVVVQGIVARLAGGAMGGQDFGPMDGLVATLVDRGRTCLADDALG